MRHVFPCLCWCVLAACSPRGDALRVVLETTPGRADTCFVVEVRDGDVVRAEARVPRLEDRERYVVAVFREGLPADVTLVARALAGVDCASDTRPNGESAPVSARFDPARVVEVTVSLTGGDADGDGFVSLAGGGQDCDDTTPARSPASQEVCRGGVDFDCDGLSGCLDPGCPADACGDRPFALALISVPTSVELGACSPGGVELRDQAGRRTRSERPVDVSLGGPFSFFSDASCTDAVSRVALTEAAAFFFSSSTLGPALLTAQGGLGLASAPVEVVRAPPAAVRFTGGSVSALAGACSPAVPLGLFDAQGRPTVARTSLTVQLTSTAQGPFSLYDDAACTQAFGGALELAADAGEGRFFFSGQRAGPFTLGAASSGLMGDALSANLDAGPLATVQLSGGQSTLLAGACSAPFVVLAQDAFGNAVPPTQVTVSVPDAGAERFAGAGCVAAGPGETFSLRIPDEGSFTLIVTADGASTSLPLTVQRAGPPGSAWRWPVQVVAGARAPANGYAGYTLLAAFDARAAIDAGMVEADGRNLRVHAWEDGGWREVDRLVEGLGTATALVRFASPFELNAGVVDTRFSLFAGPFDGGAPQSDAQRVYLFFDDFEGGTLSRWAIRSGAWARATDRTRSGTGSLKYGTESDAEHVIEASPALAESDVMFEAWWNIDNTGDADVAQTLRLQPGVVKGYETNLENGAGWNLAWTQPGWAELSANRSAPAADAWTLIGLSMSGAELRVWRDRVQITPASGAYAAAAPLFPAGNIGFRKWDLGGPLWLDDVTVRRFTDPEPVVSVGAPVAVP